MQQNPSKNPFETEKVHNLLIKYSVPAMVGMMVSALYNVVDRIFIGNSPALGHEGLAGITISFPIMILQLAVGVLFGIGGSTLFSLKLGEKKQKEAESALGQAFLLLVVAGLLFAIFGQIFLKPILRLFGASEQILPYAVSYMRIIFIGSPFQMVSMGMNNFIRADGRPKFAMITMFFAAGLNIILDPIFIFVFDMGMSGAALATALAQASAAFWVIKYFTGRHCNVSLKISQLKFRFKTAARIASLGLPGFLLQFANSILNMILNKGLLHYGGDIAVSGMGIINSLQTFLIMPLVGLKQGMLPIISYNYGARKFKRVKHTVLLAIAVATALVVLGSLMINLFPKTLISAFNREPELMDFSVKALRTWLFAFPVVGFQVIAANYFQAIGRPYSAIFLTLSRQIILLIPALLILPIYFGLDGILYAAPFADLLSAMLTSVWFIIGIITLDNLHKQTTLNLAKADSDN